MKAQVLLPKIFNFSFTYKTKKEKLIPGDIVEVPFGKEKVFGVVWPSKSFAPKNIKIKRQKKKSVFPCKFRFQVLISNLDFRFRFQVWITDLRFSFGF